MADSPDEIACEKIDCGKIDYVAKLNVALERLFSDSDEMQSATKLLSSIACPSGWTPRVSLAVLKICGPDLDRIQSFVAARHEHRDIVSMAEYSLQGKNWRLRKSDPSRYQELVNEDWKNYQDWLAKFSH